MFESLELKRMNSKNSRVEHININLNELFEGGRVMYGEGGSVGRYMVQNQIGIWQGIRSNDNAVIFLAI